MDKLFLAATILVSSLTLAHAQTRDVIMLRPPSAYSSPYYPPYTSYTPYAPYGPYASYPYPPYPYAPYRASERSPRRVAAAVANPGIASVQRRLKDLGFLPGAASIDGVAGSQTRAAIASWQGSLAHPTTGLLTPAEVQALFEAPRVSATPTSHTPAPQASLPAAPEVLGQAAMSAPSGATH